MQGSNYKSLLVVTSLTTGAAVMMIELLGSRIISPYFGVSLYVWTSLITVTLLALAAGYWWGGQLADKKRTANYLYFLIFLAGSFLLFIPFLKRSFVSLSLQLGLRLGSLASCFLLFSFPLFLLGAVTPYLVRLYTQDLNQIGHIVGYLYAISTVGSFLGTSLTGFVLIPHFSNETILLFVAFMLIFLSLCYWLFFRSRKSFIFIFFMGLIAILLGSLKFIYKPVNQEIIDHNHLFLTTEKNSVYGQIKVVEINGRFRALVLDGLIQSLIDVTSGLSIHEYTYALQLIAKSYNPEGRKALVIGLGAGIIPSELNRDGFEVDCVEIDPAIVEIAEKFFDFDSKDINIFAQDARYFVKRCPERYDLVFLDAFNGDSVPEHLLTVEMFFDLKRLMNPGGVLCFNFFGSLARGYSFGTYSIAKTLHYVFPYITTFANLPQDKIAGNIYFLAMNEAQELSQLIELDPRYCFLPVYGELKSLWERKIDLNTNTTNALILKDSYNPVAFFDTVTREVTRKRMQALFGKLLL